MAAAAIATATVTPPSRWNSRVMDTILRDGDRFYSQVYTGYEYLNAAEILEREFMLFGIHRLRFVADGEGIDGLWQPVVPGVLNLTAGLRQFFTYSAQGILTMSGLSVAVMRSGDGDLWLFDSHSRDAAGSVCDDGTAIMMRLPSVEAINQIVGQNFRPATNDQFSLTPIIAVVQFDATAENERLLRLFHLTSQTNYRESHRDEIQASQHGYWESNRDNIQGQRREQQQQRRIINYRRGLSDAVPDRFTFSPMDNVCCHCGALYSTAEKNTRGKFTLCCCNGKVALPVDENYPRQLSALMKYGHPDSVNFMSHIRNYNNALAFASIGCNISIPPGRGPFTFRIHGQVYHQIGPLMPEPGREHAYGQLYILDSDEALQRRMARPSNTECRPRLMQFLEGVLQQVNNPYIGAFKHMHQVVREETEAAAATGREIRPVTMVFRGDHHLDRRRYNVPVGGEIGAVFVGDNGGPPTNIDIRVYHRSGRLERITSDNPHCDPMCYPLLFPRGELGWEYGIGHSDGKGTLKRTAVTKREMAAFRLMERGAFNPELMAGKLTQQRIVHQYVNIEEHRLRFLRMNQGNLRIELYSGLMDQLANHAPDRPIGRLFILPSSFIGSPRHMQQLYQDAMSVVRKYGKPDVLITCTMNPQCGEISRELIRHHDHMKASDRPDIVARVAKIYFDELFQDLYHKNVLGKVKAHLNVVEFQKRGLPHVHTLIILEDNDKIRDVETLDCLISAEIPDRNTEPELYDAVKAHMIHGPCGALNPRSPCMADGKCSKSFPKQFREETAMDVDGYPLYRRRNNGRTMTVAGHEIDSRWVVPYNRFLLLKFGAHINVEHCASVKSVKYIYKYICKGHDKARLEVNQTNAEDHANDAQEPLDRDEIKEFVDARYVSPPEAMWRILEFPLHRQSHTVLRLDVHLPMQQTVVFRPENAEDAAQRAATKDTTLTAWFKLNQEEEAARMLLYHEVPEHYTWDKSRRIWKKRARGHDSKVIGRMYAISPRDAEKYFLRLLLLHVRGAQSFTELRTVDGLIYDTNREAAMARNLLEDDMEWQRCLEEAATFRMPHQLRELFVSILVFNHPTDPLALWLKFVNDLAEDGIRRYGADAGIQWALQDISSRLEAFGQHPANFNLPEPVFPVSEVPDAEAIDPEVESRKAEEILAVLTADQTNVFQAVMAKVLDPDPLTPKHCDLFTSAGSGKTTIYKALIHQLRSMGKTVVATASTGIAACLLPHGSTSHSALKIPIPVTEISVLSIKNGSKEWCKIQNLDLLIIDEAGMLHKHAFEAIDRTFRDILGISDTPFGGKAVLIGGDKKQLLPVLPRQDELASVEAFVRFSGLWESFTHLNLPPRNMRAEGEESFRVWLEDLGNGRIPPMVPERPNVILLPEEFAITDDVVESTFSRNILDDPEELKNRAILCPKNEATFRINDRIIQQLPGREKIYLSCDSVQTDDENEAMNFPIEFLNQQTPNGMPRHRLQLKVGAIIMLLRNLNPGSGMCNGARLIVRELRDNVIVAEQMVGAFAGQRVFIPRIILAPSTSGLPFVLRRRQFPVRVSYAMTINKAQGQTLQQVGLFLPEPCFAHGQLYVACSRAKGWRGLTAQILPFGDVQGRTAEGRYFTQNVVRRQVLD